MAGGGKSQRTLRLIDEALDVLSAIQPASVRAVCHQLFTRGVIDSMTTANTNRVGRQLTWAREQGIAQTDRKAQRRARIWRRARWQRVYAEDAAFQLQ